VSTTRKAYPSDVSADEWAFASSCLTLSREDAGPRAHSLREVFNARRWVERTFAWMARFRRRVRDYKRLAPTLAGWHGVVFGALLLHRLVLLPIPRS
jgi:hypothetical protein